MFVRRPFVRAGRPGLIGTAARTAVVAGTATAVAGRVAQRQQAHATQAAEAQAYEQQQAAARSGPPAPSAGTGDIAELQRLADMHSQGLLTDDEFAAAKSRLLGL
ncbi:SHOCT domain-containing protein [Desertimonas flava]|uniref:SHOCT domain-containing protein n=1 Tax=Desertimonas flava TaxID=2064846 RepID=UPI000E340E6A|nr:SHOCT domain-containing protein [Desertimonas flava]